jgi:serine/threonine protein phosphatase PrpC
MRDVRGYRVTAIGQTDVGMRRENNEDSFLIADLTTGIIGRPFSIFQREIGESGCLLIVADGMGGAEAGEVASAMAVRTIFERMRTRLGAGGNADHSRFVEALREAVHEADLAIHRASETQAEYRGMGTTVTAAAVQGDRASFAQVGDSRGYLVRGETITQVTQDQSFVNELVASGVLRPEDAHGHPQRHVILQALGVGVDVNVVVSFADLQPGDVIIVCSDGLSEKVTAEEMRDTIRTIWNVADACGRLVALARERGGEDNITAVVAYFDAEGSEPPPGAGGTWPTSGGSSRWWPWRARSRARNP